MDISFWTLEPIAQGDSFDWDDISSKMIGRFEQFEFMPEELRNMTLKCNPKTCVDDKCRDCAYQRTYEEYISESKTGRDFDLYCAKHGQYGPYRNLQIQILTNIGQILSILRLFINSIKIQRTCTIKMTYTVTKTY